MMEKHSSIHTFPEYALFEYCPCAPCSFSFPFYPGSQIYLRYDLWVCRLSFSSIFFFITKPYQPKLGSPPPHNNPCWPPARQGKGKGPVKNLQSHSAPTFSGFALPPFLCTVYLALLCTICLLCTAPWFFPPLHRFAPLGFALFCTDCLILHNFAALHLHLRSEVNFKSFAFCHIIVVLLICCNYNVFDTLQLQCCRLSLYLKIAQVHASKYPTTSHGVPISC